ncbi:MAG: hypothetical protein ACR2RB_05755, partial [Gammaproteobacteria bacterium]
MNEEPNWAEGLDSHLVQRLWRRALRPGLIDITQAEAIIARFDGMVDYLALAERLNQRWQPVDDEADSGPIVYVQPPSNAFGAGPGPDAPDRKATPAKTPSRPKTGRSGKRGKPADPATSPVATPPQAAGSVPSPGDSVSAGVESRGTESKTVESQTIVVQRKASDTPATTPMPIVGPQGIPGTPAAPNDVSPDAKATIESGSAPTERDLTGQPSERLPPATETRQPAPADATAAPSARPLPVVSPLARAKAPLTTLTTATLPAERGDGKDRSTV